jgi:transposase
MCFLRTLRHWVQRHGSANVVYFDESGFAKHSYRPHGWAKRGEKVFGKISGNNRKAINLIMAQRGSEWLAPMLFERSCTRHTVAAWMEQALLPELRPNSLVIMDNAPFHNKPHMKEILERHGHTMLALPKYSPDFNPIEQSFAILKRRRQFSSQSIDQILVGNYYVN